MEAVGERVAALRTFDHQAILAQADKTLAQADDLAPYFEQYAALHGTPYDEDARYFLAVDGPSDPRYPHLLRAFMISQQSQQFQVLWDFLFTQNELGMTELAYLRHVQTYLEAFSADAPAPQQVVVSGHIVTPLGGYVLVNRHHLRLSSASHAHPREAGSYLLLDCARPVRAANELLPHLGTVFEDFYEDEL